MGFISLISAILADHMSARLRILIHLKYAPGGSGERVISQTLFNTDSISLERNTRT